MVWRNLFRKPDQENEPEEKSAADRPVTPARDIPPHLAQAIEKRSSGGEPRPPQDPQQRKLAALRRKRVAILFDIEQGELAASPDNPWTQRIQLLTEAMVSVSDDLREAGTIEPGPYHPVPPTPITIGAIDTGDAASVVFSIAGNRFSWSEDQDWAERGHQISRSELVRRTGDIDALVPGDTPNDLRPGLRAHLGDSLFVMASDLRDRALDGDSMPSTPTLADHAAPCPICGGWTDWRGTCQTCARRNARIMELKREEGRLLDERSREAEERRRLVEGMPLARKRLRDVDADLARLGKRRNESPIQPVDGVEWAPSVVIEDATFYRRSSMSNLAEVIKSTILAREAIGVVLMLVCVIAVSANRPFFREVWNDPSRFWRVVARVAAMMTVVTLAWVTVVDDWLQLVAEPYRLSMPWDYQRVVFDPVDPALRTVSVGLIVAALAVLACLFARHIGGYLLQVGTLVLSALIWTPIFIMNQRLNAMIVQGAEASETLPEVLGLSAFWVVRMGLGVVTIGATLLTGMMLLALVATALLDLFGLRQQRITYEADGFFTELQRRAGQREDIPLKTLWRPIRRPL